MEDASLELNEILQKSVLLLKNPINLDNLQNSKSEGEKSCFWATSWTIFLKDILWIVRILVNFSTLKRHSPIIEAVKDLYIVKRVYFHY